MTTSEVNNKKYIQNICCCMCLSIFCGIIIMGNTQKCSENLIGCIISGGFFMLLIVILILICSSYTKSPNNDENIV